VADFAFLKLCLFCIHTKFLLVILSEMHHIPQTSTAQIDRHSWGMLARGVKKRAQYVFTIEHLLPTPPPGTLPAADMETAYTDAAGRTRPHFIALGAGSIGGLTLTPGLYEWSTPVVINADVPMAVTEKRVFALIQ